MNRAEEIIRPALERKIFHPIQHKKNKMEWPLNDTFKKGLRNALTGLCVISEGHSLMMVGGHRTHLVYRLREDRKI